MAQPTNGDGLPKSSEAAFWVDRGLNDFCAFGASASVRRKEERLRRERLVAQGISSEGQLRAADYCDEVDDIYFLPANVFESWDMHAAPSAEDGAELALSVEEGMDLELEEVDLSVLLAENEPCSDLPVVEGGTAVWPSVVRGDAVRLRQGAGFGSVESSSSVGGIDRSSDEPIERGDDALSKIAALKAARDALKQPVVWEAGIAAPIADQGARRPTRTAVKQLKYAKSLWELFGKLESTAAEVCRTPPCD